MVTVSEQQVIERFKKEGYFNVHSGAPDFIFYKLKKSKPNNPPQVISTLNKAIQDKPKPAKSMNDIDLGTIEFVEVKCNGDELSHEQLIWRHILKQLGLKYKLIHLDKSEVHNPPQGE